MNVGDIIEVRLEGAAADRLRSMMKAVRVGWHATKHGAYAVEVARRAEDEAVKRRVEERSADGDH